jgi:hypothetical protein
VELTIAIASRQFWDGVLHFFIRLFASPKGPNNAKS